MVAGELHRAKWKTKAQLEKLREEGRCFRCERKGCITNKRPLLPARKSRININSLELPVIDPLVCVIDDEDKDSKK